MANRIPEDLVNEIRQQTDIATVVGQYVQLRKNGKNLFGLCPFHEEKTPSFSVSEDKQIYHCFSCGRGGNVFNFLMEIDGISFREAIVKVAELAHINLPNEVKQQNEPPVNPEIALQKEIHKQATTLFHYILTTTEVGEQALEYLHSRGMSDEIIETFSIGFAPDSGHLLLDYFTEQKTDYEALRKSGLFIENSQGSLQDRFHGRIMFPVKNANSDVIGFSGRVLIKQENSPKYLNSPETELFNKRNILFNFDLARSSIRLEKKVYLFEGFMDVIAAYTSGIKNGVASMGTSLTEEQTYQLSRQTSEVIITYDGDDPGIEATKRAIDILTLTKRFTIGILSLPEGIDPDEYTQKYGAEKFRQFVASAVETPVAFKLRYLKRGLNMDNEKDKLDYVDLALTTLTELNSQVEREIYLDQLSRQLALDKSVLNQRFDELFQETKQAQQRAKRRESAVAVATPPTQKTKYNQSEKAERMLLHMLFLDENLFVRLNKDEDFHFIHEDYQSLFNLWEGYLLKADTADISGFIDFLPSNELKQQVSEIEMMNVPTEMSDDALADFIRIISQQAFFTQIKAKQHALVEAKRLGDKDLEMQLTNDIIVLTRKVKQ